jgi:Dockerin type I domain
VYSESILLDKSNLTAALLLRITWDTEGFVYGDYVLSAQTVDMGRSSFTSRIICDAIVHVGVPGDVNNDSIVNMRDVQRAVFLFNSFSNMSRWDPNADLDNNGRIDMRDIIMIVLNFGKQ